MVETWIVAVICWMVALAAFGYGFYLSKEVHQRRSAADYAVRPDYFRISSDSVAGWIFGAIASTLAGLFVGLFFKLLPWWLARGIFFGIGIGFILLGLDALRGG